MLLRRLRTENEGSALVELALMAGLLGVPMLLGTSEIAPLVYDEVEIASAAHAGALYGMQSQIFALDATGMIIAAQVEATDFNTSLTVTPTTYFVCANAIAGVQYTGGNAEANAQSACTGANNHPLQFVRVTAAAQVTPTIHAPGLPAVFTLVSTSVMEVQQ